MNDLRSRYRSLPMSRTYRFLIVQTSTKGFKLHFKKQKKIEKSLKLSCKLTVAYETSGAFLIEECFWLDCGLAQFNSLLTSLTNSIIFMTLQQLIVYLIFWYTWSFPIFPSRTKDRRNPAPHILSSFSPIGHRCFLSFCITPYSFSTFFGLYILFDYTFCSI